MVYYCFAHTRLSASSSCRSCSKRAQSELRMVSWRVTTLMRSIRNYFDFVMSSLCAASYTFADVGVVIVDYGYCDGVSTNFILFTFFTLSVSLVLFAFSLLTLLLDDNLRIIITSNKQKTPPNNLRQLLYCIYKSKLCKRCNHKNIIDTSYFICG